MSWFSNSAAVEVETQLTPDERRTEALAELAATKKELFAMEQVLIAELSPRTFSICSRELSFSPVLWRIDTGQ